jgi:hypothetical protein
VLSQH